MKLDSILRPECVVAKSTVTSKAKAIEEVARLASHSPVLHNIETDTLHVQLQAREKQASTGFENGVAIPHCSLDMIESFVVGAITLQKGVDYRSLDGKSTRIIFFIVGPKAERTRHVKLLSAISRLTRDPALVDELVAIDSNEQLRRRIIEAIDYEEEEPRRSLSLLHVYVQNQNQFEPILELITSYTEGLLLVEELKSPSHYLHRVPLFATMWNDEADTQVRYVQAMVKTSNCNDLIRKISLLKGEPLKSAGVMIAVHDLSYVTGILEL